MTRFLLIHLPRTLLGLLFLVSAAEGFWFLATGEHLIHPSTSEAGLAFERSLHASGFLWPLLKIVNLLGGLSLLLNWAPAFGLALLAPVMTVIALFHLVLNPGGIPMAAAMVLCAGLLVHAYRDRYAALFR